MSGATGHIYKPLAERFWDKVDMTAGPSGCWLWMAARAGPYGTFDDGIKQMGAHRFAYRLHYGALPQGLPIDHLCKIPLCVNPDHLEAVTTRENVRRSSSPTAINMVKTHCVRNHPFNELNTYLLRGNRQCRTCRRAYSKEYEKTRRPGGANERHQ